MSTIKSLLVERTDHLHDRFDAQYETILFFDLTKEKYKSIVRTLYSYYLPAEEKLQSFLSLRQQPCLQYDRSRVPALKQDLLALGETEETIQQIPLYPNIPALDTLPDVLGYMYIIEGSIFGNALVMQQLNEELAITSENGAAFFAIVDPEIVRARWNGFLDMLNAYATDHPENNEAIIKVAIDTILSYEQCLFEGKVTKIKRIDAAAHGHAHNHGHAHEHEHEHAHEH